MEGGVTLLVSGCEFGVLSNHVDVVDRVGLGRRDGGGKVGVGTQRRGLVWRG